MLTFLWLDDTTANGRFIYALDDAYIHLQMATTLATHGVWGVSPQATVAASSSPLWVLLLATAHRISENFEIVPFIINVAGAAGLLFLMDWQGEALGWEGASPSLRFCLLVWFVFLIPLPALVFTGMEHVLHALLGLAFLGTAARYLWPPGEAPTADRPFLLMCLWAVLAVGIRYESLALVFPVVIVLLWRGEWRTGTMLGAAACLPVVGFGSFCWSRGGTFIPLSILVKTVGIFQGVPWYVTWLPGIKGTMRLFHCPSLLLLTGLGAYALGKSRWDSPKGRPILGDRLSGAVALFLVAAALQVEFGDIGWFFRYEAYLVVLGMLTAFPAFLRVLGIPLGPGPNQEFQRPPPRPARVLVLLASLLLFERVGQATWATPLAYRNIGAQQIQVSRFLRQYASSAPVALNDVGATSFFSGKPILDLWGLISPQVAMVRLRHAYDSAAIARLASEAGVESAVVFPEWFADYGGMPASWIPVASWRIPRNVVCGSDTVVFYAVSPATREHLETSLRRFSSSLPEGVQVTFTDPPPAKIGH
ncbi:MAG: hypothetical protein GX442_22555 [Candidatus Riflebacteria bacterium]|nr:hypothetical protein [Candidatus Riflebacteria bacterium]